MEGKLGERGHMTHARTSDCTCLIVPPNLYPPSGPYCPQTALDLSVPWIRQPPSHIHLPNIHLGPLFIWLASAGLPSYVSSAVLASLLRYHSPVLLSTRFAISFQHQIMRSIAMRPRSETLSVRRTRSPPRPHLEWTYMTT